MATKTKTINVKVSVSKIITALEKSLAAREKSIIDHNKAGKEYEKAQKEFKDYLTELFRSGKGKVIAVGNAYRYSEVEKWEFTVEFPSSVKPPKSPESFLEWQVKQEIDEIKNAIAILKMTDEEIVSTNTYSGVAQYI